MPVVSEKVIKPPESFKGFKSEKGLLYNLNQLTNLLDPGNISGALSIFTTGGFQLPKTAEFTEEAIKAMAPQLKKPIWDFLRRYPLKVTRSRMAPTSFYDPTLREIGLAKKEALPHEWFHYLEDIIKPVRERTQRMWQLTPGQIQDWLYQGYKKPVQEAIEAWGPSGARRYLANELGARLLSQPTLTEQSGLSQMLKYNPHLVEEVQRLERYLQPETAYGVHELLRGIPYP